VNVVIEFNNVVNAASISLETPANFDPSKSRESRFMHQRIGPVLELGEVALSSKATNHRRW
jgi:hypothetical protein